MPLGAAGMRFQAGVAVGAAGADAGAGACAGADAGAGAHADADAGAGAAAGADVDAAAGPGAGAGAGADAAAAAAAADSADAAGAPWLNILKQWWAVFGNDPNDAAGARSVLLAAHSRGKPEMMVSAAFPFLTPVQVRKFIDMEAFDIFKNKKGGKNKQAKADAWDASRRLVELAEIHGSQLVVWGCGGGMDRLVQISTTTGFIEPDKMRPLNHKSRQAGEHQALGIRHHQLADGRYGTLNMSSTSDGTGTYKVEILRKGAVTTTFFLGVYPHPGSMSWGSVETRTSEHIKFLTALATGTPAQPHIVRIDADRF